MTGTPLIEAQGVTRVLPGLVPVTLVRDIDLIIGEGKFVAITGPSGSGKSSLLYLLSLLDVPSSGRILLEGKDTSALDADALAALRLENIGFVFQFHFLLPEFTAEQNVLIPMRRLARLPEREMRARAKDLLDDLGLSEHRAKRPEQLSGGQRQRVAIARALANDPRIIMADEPTGNLDTHSSQTVLEIFAQLAHRRGKSVVTVTHDLGFAARADRRVHLVDGRIESDSGHA